MKRLIIKNHSVNLIRPEPSASGLYVQFAWTTENQLATDVTITHRAADGRQLNTENFPRDEARKRWASLLTAGWQRQVICGILT